MNAHPAEPYLRYVRATAMRYGTNLKRQDAEDLESYLALRLLEEWPKYDPHRGAAPDTYAIYVLRFAVHRWRDQRKRRGMTQYAFKIWREAPEGSPAWEALPPATKAMVEGQRQVGMPLPLDSPVSIWSDEGEWAETIGGFSVADSSPTPEERLLTRPEASEIGRRVLALPERQREATLLRYWEDLDHKAIAVRMGIGPAGVNHLLVRALANLRQAPGERP